MTRARDVANIDGLLTTTGDTYYASAAGTPARLGIGTTGQVLNVSGGVPAWTTASSGAMTLVTRASFSAVATTGTTFDNIFTSTYNTYLVVIESLTNGSNGGDLHFQLRTSGPTTKASQYYGAQYEVPFNSTTIQNIQQSSTTEYTLTGAGGDAGQPSSAMLYFNQVGPSGGRAKWYGSGAVEGVRTATFGGMNDGSAAYLGLLFKADTGNITGAIAVYGLAK